MEGPYDCPHHLHDYQHGILGVLRAGWNVADALADRNVSREILGWTMPASMTQFFNPAFIIIFGSIFSVMWVKLDQIGKNPSIPMKFALGILQLGAGFLVTLVGLHW